MSFVRRNRIAIGLGAGVLLLLLAVTWLNRDSGQTGGALDPQNAGPTGARAVAQVLGDHGVEVDIARGRAELAKARIDSDTTVVITNVDALGASTWDSVDSQVDRVGGVLVVAGLNPTVADGVGVLDRNVTEGPAGTDIDAACDPAIPLMDGLDLSSEYGGYAVRGDGCFGGPSGRLLLIDRQQHRWVLTDPSPVTNEEIDRSDNAAIVLRLFGQRDRVVWYVADADDTLISDGVGVGRLLPDWLIPSLWLIGLAAVALVLVQARRLGPLVVEPMPVTIKALESTTGLGRLYEQARDRGHAAQLLVEGTARRLGPLLGLAEHTPRDELVRATAARSGRTVAEIEALLPEPGGIAQAVRTDADLVALAQDLHRTEEEVRSR